MAQIWIGTVFGVQTMRGFSVVFQLRHAKRFRTEENNIGQGGFDLICNISKGEELAEV